MVQVQALDAPASDVTVDYEWKARVAWKSEYTPTACEDRYQADPEHGLFALADGLGMMSNAALWAQLLVDQWTAEPPVIAVPPLMTSAAPPTAPDSEEQGADTLVSENGAPALVLLQFEVEHWLRRVQQRYSLRAPTLDEHAALPESKQKARLGSGATLLATTLQPDVLAAGTPTLEVTCFARGDSTAFLISRSQTVPELTIRTFPITDVSQYSTYTTCLRSKSFDRRSEVLELWRNSLQVGDILLLATDAVAKCLFGMLESDAGATLADLASFSKETWRERVTALRAQGELVDDDSSYIMIRQLPTGTKTASPGWKHATLSLATVQADYIRWGERRRAEARAALERDDVRELARIVGAEIYFQGEPNGEFRAAAARGRQVTLAMEKIFVELADVSRSTPPAGSASRLAALRELWQETASVLALEPAAATLRQTLTEMGVISARHEEV